MSQSTLISIVLAVLIIAIFLIDYLKKRKEDSLEKSVEKFVEKEKTGKKSWFNLKSFFWLYPIYFIVIPLFIIYLEKNMTGGLYEVIYGQGGYLDALEALLEGPEEYWLGIYPLIIIHLLLYVFSKYSNWILKRKKNIAMFIFALIILKVMLHFFIYPEIEIYTPKKYSTW